MLFRAVVLATLLASALAALGDARFMDALAVGRNNTLARTPRDGLHGDHGHDHDRDRDCPATHDALRAALVAALQQPNGGFGLPMWASVVDRTGKTCAVAYSGSALGDQWPGSRVISLQKANTANAFSLPGLALSTANLYSAVQPGGTLFGLQESNPVNAAAAYADPANAWGSSHDPAVGQRIGGINVFGGGLALYNATAILGGLGVSGDSSCADHNIAWRVRKNLGQSLGCLLHTPTHGCAAGEDHHSSSAVTRLTCALWCQAWTTFPPV